MHPDDTAPDPTTAPVGSRWENADTGDVFVRTEDGWRAEIDTAAIAAETARHRETMRACRAAVAAAFGRHGVPSEGPDRYEIRMSDQNVPGQYGVSDHVMVVNLVREGDSHFSIDAEWPHWHPYDGGYWVGSSLRFQGNVSPLAIEVMQTILPHVPVEG